MQTTDITYELLYKHYKANTTGSKKFLLFVDILSKGHLSFKDLALDIFNIPSVNLNSSKENINVPFSWKKHCNSAIYTRTWVRCWGMWNHFFINSKWEYLSFAYFLWISLLLDWIILLVIIENKLNGCNEPIFHFHDHRLYHLDQTAPKSIKLDKEYAVRTITFVAHVFSAFMVIMLFLIIKSQSHGCCNW